VPRLDIRTAGDGPKRAAMWLDGTPCMVKGLDHWPKVGERFVIDGVLYRLVEISDRWVWEREARGKRETVNQRFRVGARHAEHLVAARRAPQKAWSHPTAVAFALLVSVMTAPAADIDTSVPPAFSDVTTAAGLEVFSPTFGAVFSDLDGDGDDDLIVSQHGRGPALFLNQGGARFVDATHLLADTKGDRHGVVVADLDNDGDRDVVIAGGGQDGVGEGRRNQTLRNLLVESGSLTFANVSDSSGLGDESRFRARALLPMSSPDGRGVDLYLTCLSRTGYPNQYYRNRSGVEIRFEPDDGPGLTWSFSSEGRDLVVDIDRDGDQDLLLIDRRRIIVLRRDGTVFVRVESALSAIPRVSSIAAGDLDNDGYPDLFVGMATTGTDSDQVTSDPGRVQFAFNDHGDNDVDSMRFTTTSDEIQVDLEVKTGSWALEPSRIFLGSAYSHPTGSQFVTTKSAAAGEPMVRNEAGAYIWFDGFEHEWHLFWRHDQSATHPYRGSIDAEGVGDVASEEIETSQPTATGFDQLYRNLGGVFHPWPNAPQFSHQLTTVSALLADLDNNGRIDIVAVRHGEPCAPNGEPLVILNRGDFGFEVHTDIGLSVPADDIYRADQVITGLVDDDGLPDLFVSNGFGLKPSNLGPFSLFLNTTPTVHHYVVLELIGGPSNRDAIGAQVELYSVSDDRLLGYRELGSGFNRFQSSHLLHFGLGPEEGPVGIRIRWPSGGVSKHRVTVDRRHRIKERVKPRRGARRGNRDQRVECSDSGNSATREGTD